MKPKKITSRDVAQMAGVSRTTVSLVLNNRPGVVIPESTRERVFAAARELQYHPHPAAQALASGKTGIVGVWASRLHTPYHASVLGHLHAEIKSRGLEMMINNTEPCVNWRSHMRNLAQWNVDGIVAFGCPEYIHAYFELEGARPLAMVGLDVHPEELGSGTVPVDLVAVDHYAGARLAMEHLLRRSGRLAFLTHAAMPGTGAGEPRLHVYREAMRAAGRAEEIVSASWTGPREAREAMAEHVRRHGAPAGVFCFCDTMAVGAHKALLEAGLSIPGDVALVGYDNIWSDEFLHPALSSVGYGQSDACRLACEHLARRMAESGAPMRTSWLTPQLHVRASSC